MDRCRKKQETPLAAAVGRRRVGQGAPTRWLSRWCLFVLCSQAEWCCMRAAGWVVDGGGSGRVALTAMPNRMRASSTTHGGLFAPPHSMREPRTPRARTIEPAPSTATVASCAHPTSRPAPQAFSDAGEALWLGLSLWFITWHYFITAILVILYARRVCAYPASAGDGRKLRSSWWLLAVPVALPGVVVLDLLMLVTSLLPLISKQVGAGRRGTGRRRRRRGRRPAQRAPVALQGRPYRPVGAVTSPRHRCRSRASRQREPAP